MPRVHARLTGALRLAALPLALAVAMGVAPSDVVAQDKVHNLNELSELPKLRDTKQAVKTISNAYPKKLQRNNVGGKVQLKFVVNADGSVDEATIEVVAAAVDELGEAARTAAAGLVFLPGKIDGEPVRTAVLFPISFGG